jgi:hypothetical protein
MNRDIYTTTWRCSMSGGVRGAVLGRSALLPF